MAKTKIVHLGHRERWFLGQLAGMLREGQDKTSDGLNRAGLRLGADCLRLLGLLTPHPGRLPEASGGPGRSTLEGDDQVRLGDAEQTLLASLRLYWVDGDGLRWAALNARTLRLAEEYLRYTGMLDDYPGESVFDDLMTLEGSVADPDQPVEASINGSSETDGGSENGSDRTIEGDTNGSISGTKKGPRAIPKGPVKVLEECQRAGECAACETPFSAKSKILFEPETALTWGWDCCDTARELAASVAV